MYEKTQTVLRLHAHAEEENTHLRYLLLRRSSSSSLEFETLGRKPKGGQLSPRSHEVPLAGLGRCESVGKHFGVIGSNFGMPGYCDRAKELGGMLGNCEAATSGGKQGGEHGRPHSL